MATKFLVGGDATGDHDGSWGIIVEGFFGFIYQCFNGNVLETGGKISPLDIV